jgi:phage-related protein
MASDDLTVAPDYVFEEEIKYSTAVSKFENGTEQRRALWSTPIRKFKLTFKNRNSTDAGTLRTLFNAQLGALTPFLWTNPNDSVQYSVRFEDDSFSLRQKAYGIFDAEFNLVQVK